MVVLKELILKVSILGQCGDLEKTGSFTISTFGGCCGLERTDFKQFLFWEAVVVLKDLILNSFYF